MPNAEFLLEMREITKRYPGVLALDKARLQVRPGEVHCLLGENGAGKSTLMKILAGAEKMDHGQILIEGQPVTIQSPHHAQELGISMIYQEFNLSPFLSVAENIFIGRYPTRRGLPFIQWRVLHNAACTLLEEIGVEMDVRRPVNELSIAEQQMVEIAKALSFNARIIVMDEPSATLTDHELKALFTLIKHLRRQGIGIVYISHRLEEIFQIGNCVTIMRDGQWISTDKIYDLNREEIIRRMVGRELEEEFPKQLFARGAERLRAENLSRKGVFDGVSFSLHAGEIVGLTGLIGSGRTEVARAIFGADKLNSGHIFLDDSEVRIKSPQDAINDGIGFLTEDRKNSGLILNMTVRENISLANLAALRKLFFIDGKIERKTTQGYIEELRIKTPSSEQTVQNLSGGNQQKVVLAKWLFTKSRVLIFDEPTRGIDVGAKVEIYKLMNALVEQGVAILMITSELPEALGMCDRIMVMHEGRIAGELPREIATQESIMALATGHGVCA